MSARDERRPEEGVPEPSGNGAGPSPPLRLGGMALRNGLLIHGPTSWAVAARTADGRIEVRSGPKPVLSRGRLGSTPLLRGPLRLAEAFAVVPIARRRLPAARLPVEDSRVLAVGIASAVVTTMIRRLAGAGESGARATFREALVAGLGLLPAMTALRDRDLAAYHGVEHKAIGAYERGSTDPAEAPKEHDRCGSNLIVPMLVLSAAGQVVLARLVRNPGPAARSLAGLAGLSGAVELFVYAERRPDSAVGRGVHRVGHEIQRLFSTKEPSDAQLEVGAAALGAVLREEAEG